MGHLVDQFAMLASTHDAAVFGTGFGAPMRANLLKYLDRRLPRYTSYPTAVQFGPAIDAAAYEH